MLVATTTTTTNHERWASAGQPVCPPPLNATINKHWGQTDGEDESKEQQRVTMTNGEVDGHDNDNCRTMSAGAATSKQQST